MSPTPRLPDLRLADAGRTFAMRPGSERMLVLDRAAQPPTVHGPDGVVTVWEERGPQESRPGGPSGTIGYRVRAIGRGRVTVRSGDAQWRIEVGGAPRPPEQTRDDTDSGWGQDESGMSQRWWEEQRPPHW